MFCHQRQAIEIELEFVADILALLSQLYTWLEHIGFMPLDYSLVTWLYGYPSTLS